jgi:hypothetical protein
MSAQGVNMKRCFFLVMVFAAVLVHAQDTRKTEAIKRLLELTNVKEQAEQAFDLILPQFRALIPAVPAEFWDLFRKNLDFEGFVALHIPIYDRYYSYEDIMGMIAFYETPLGKKIVRAESQMAKETMLAGEAWGAEMAKKILERIKKEGYMDT